MDRDDDVALLFVIKAMIKNQMAKFLSWNA
jgi:hypothetical protein